MDMDGVIDESQWQLLETFQETATGNGCFGNSFYDGLMGLGCDEFDPAVNTTGVTGTGTGTAIGAGAGGSMAPLLVGFCQWCESDHIQLVDGNYVCLDCFGIVNRFIDTGAEWRNFAANGGKGDMNRCGMPVNELLPDSSVGSIIGYGGKNTRDMRVLRKYHMWNNISYKERTLYNVFDTLTLNTANHGINKTILEEAKNLYKKMTDARLTRGDNRNGLIASSIYIACKTQGAPRSAKEIAKMFNISSTVMTRACKHFQEILNLSTQSTTAEDFIARICSRINLGKDEQDKCMAVIRRADALGMVSENTPPSIAAAIIYLCSEKFGWNVDKDELSMACDVSAVTVLKCWKKLDMYSEHLF